MDLTIAEKINEVLDSCPVSPAGLGEAAWVRARLEPVLTRAKDLGAPVQDLFIEVSADLADLLAEQSFGSGSFGPGVDVHLEVTDEDLAGGFLVSVLTGQGRLDAVLHQAVGFAYPTPRDAQEVETRWHLQMWDGVDPVQAAEVAEAL
jgi:hypothetical protein